ncbi:MAG: pimeloyl-ACP methyl ester carboxylesterase [Gammaproteobacteria bacterium]|jgi:pimeloyl-ACP methyl ester carboxylesterase
MKTSITSLILLFTFLISGAMIAQVKMNFKFDTPYGDNPAVGKYVELDGSEIYYEEYGKGEPLLLIHGQYGSIKWLGNQIEYFKNKYRVIIADNRGYGKTRLNTAPLTYDIVVKDLEGLVDYLKLDSLSIYGWGDGGTMALRMGINKKSKVKKIVAKSAYLRFDSTALHTSYMDTFINSSKIVASKIVQKDTTQNWNLEIQRLKQVINETYIPTSDMSKIKAQVLIIAGDKDVVKGEHSLELYKNISQAKLCIMPGETLFTPASNPIKFNAIVNDFLSKPFKRPSSDTVELIGL